MARVKRGFSSHKKHKKLLEQAKGFWMTRHKLVRKAKEAVLHAGQYAYAGRKDRKSQARRSWILSINEALKTQSASEGPQRIKYSQFIAKLKKANILLDRKILSDLVVNDNVTFQKIVEFTSSK